MLTSLIMLAAVCALSSAKSLPSFHEFEIVERPSKFETVVTATGAKPAMAIGGLPVWYNRTMASQSLAKEYLAAETAPLRPLDEDDFFKFIPVFVGSVSPTSGTLRWNSSDFPDAPCFQTGSAFFNMTGDSQGEITVHVGRKSSALCSDFFLFASVETFHVDSISIAGTHKIKLTKLSPENIADIAANGIRIFHFPREVLSEVASLWDTILLFLRAEVPLGPPEVPDHVEKMNVEFLKDKMGFTMEKRRINRVNISKASVGSGDFLGIMRLDGLDPMIAWGMGAHTGHTVMTLWMDGELYVTESQTASHYWPTPHIQKTPWDEWIELAHKASYNVIHMPLNAAARAKFNETAAIAEFKRMEGVPYGMNAFLTGWIDSPEGNYPAPLSEQMVQILFSIVQEISPNETNVMWNQMLCHRLDINFTAYEEVPKAYELYATMHERGLRFGDVLAMPEQDDWLYLMPNWDHPDVLVNSMVCNVWVCNGQRAGGIYGDAEFQCGETTNANIEMLAVFDLNSTRPQACIDADPDLPFCQIMGNYRMTIPYYSSTTPHANMSNYCVGQSPDYWFADFAHGKC